MQSPLIAKKSSMPIRRCFCSTALLRMEAFDTGAAVVLHPVALIMKAGWYGKICSKRNSHRIRRWRRATAQFRTCECGFVPV